MFYYKMIVSYNGSYFYGWQKTPDGISVQSTLEAAVSKAHGGGEFKINGASRTDRGVHAYGQCFTVKTEKYWEANKLKRAINAYLNYEKVSILSCALTVEEFSARHNALGKIYHYSVYLSDVISPLLYPYFFLWYLPIDLIKLSHACEVLINCKNLNGFAHGYQQLSRPYTLEKLQYELNGKKLLLIFQGKGFFHHEIRFLVAHILRYSSNILTEESFFIPINSPEKNDFIKHLSPGKGLSLMEIFY